MSDSGMNQFKFIDYSDDYRELVIELFRQTFTDSEGEEQGRLLAHLVARLVDTEEPDAVSVYLLSDAQQIAGCIVHSRLFLSSSHRASILSPVAISSEYQGQGLGQRLIRHGLERRKRGGEQFVLTYGDPAFYSKSGFRSVDPDRIRPPFKLSYPHGWLGIAFDEVSLDEIQTECICVEALQDAVYW